MPKRHIYLDHGASTPVHPQVLQAMLPYWQNVYGNPSSNHIFGRAASTALNEARAAIAAQINANPDNIIFTGCGSESDNLALKGIMWPARQNGRGNHLIISSIEHSAITHTAEQLRGNHGFQLTILPVDQFGRVDPDDVRRAIRPETALISIMAANNEIGTLQPIQAIGEIARHHGVIFHTDAIQAIATKTWDMQDLPIDLMSIAPHKFYGPKGIGILHVRDGIDLQPTLTGGGQENGRRAGTENLPYIVGAAEALRLSQETLADSLTHYTMLRDRLIQGITSALDEDCQLTGHPTDRLPHNASFAFQHISGNDMLMHLDLAGIAASSGSACKTGDPKPSATLQAIGLGPEWTLGGLRLTVGRQNTQDEIDETIAIIPEIVRKLQHLNMTVV